MFALSYCFYLISLVRPANIETTSWGAALAAGLYLEWPLSDEHARATTFYPEAPIDGYADTIPINFCSKWFSVLIEKSHFPCALQILLSCWPYAMYITFYFSIVERKVIVHSCSVNFDRVVALWVTYRICCASAERDEKYEFWKRAVARSIGWTGESSMPSRFNSCS